MKNLLYGVHSRISTLPQAQFICMAYFDTYQDRLVEKALYKFPKTKHFYFKPHAQLKRFADKSCQPYIFLNKIVTTQC